MSNLQMFTRTSKIAVRKFIEGVKELLQYKIVAILLVCHWILFGIGNILEKPELTSFEIAGIASIQLLVAIWIFANGWIVFSWWHIWKLMVKKHRR